MHGAPITADASLPGDITDSISLVIDFGTLVGNSTISHKDVGDGLFAGINVFVQLIIACFSNPFSLTNIQ